MKLHHLTVVSLIALSTPSCEFDDAAFASMMDGLSAISRDYGRLNGGYASTYTGNSSGSSSAGSSSYPGNSSGLSSGGYSSSYTASSNSSSDGGYTPNPMSNSGSSTIGGSTANYRGSSGRFPQDNGIPASRASQLQRDYRPTASSNSRAYTNNATDKTVSFNPRTSELWKNPVTGKYEAVLRENSVGVSESNRGLDNGIPTSQTAKWQEENSPTTGSNWRTYTNSDTGQTVSFNPRTSELWKNPVTGKYEAVLRENSVGVSESNSVGVSEFNRVRDNGIPASQTAKWKEENSPTTSSNWRTYTNSDTGQKVSFNPRTSELWKNPVTDKYEAIVREGNMKWICNAYGTEHDGPSECSKPGEGGRWISK